MAGGESVRDEIAELEALLTQVKTAGNKRDLEQLLATKQHQLKQAEEAQDEPMPAVTATPELPQPTPVKISAHVVKPEDAAKDVNTYTEISRFGWEDDGYGKDKVTVHIMSGVDGVGDLPKENVTCTFTKDAFDLKILGLNGKNFRLVKNHLDKPIIPSKSTFRVKKNRVSVTLWKEDKNNTWMNLTAKNPTKQQNRPTSADPSAGIMDMMKEMYENGDEDMKRTIAKAWSESREKQAAGAGAGMGGDGMF